ncbi:DUF5715 family protein [Rubricoccus marinus]|uniref:Peptidase M15B domain-containing protein n=1 Tax=Rubricoccus marinus TaxID=716817 RepID=A0A259TYH1_9BACT|nr:DUF5715 family protein [Rubricoccus marinus]OZC02823.1 hypothetical protein BSZ36_07455 [Rubricoccus marinus]
MMRTLGFVLLLLLASGLAFALGWNQRDQRVPPPPPPEAADSPALDSLDARAARLRGALERLAPPSPEEENSLRRPRTPNYRVHLGWADSLGVQPLASEAELGRHLASGALVPLVDTEFYVVRTLEHSKPFTTPALRESLAEAGRRFQAELARSGLPPYRFSVSSALRTADLQADLGRRNRNATSGTSSHEYGASVDIVTFRYAYASSPQDSITVDVADPHLDRANRLLVDTYTEAARSRWDHLYGALARALGSMQRDERLVVLLEAEQPVFHVTHRIPGDLDRSDPDSD